MKVGSFFPNRREPTFYAMAGDDCSLFFDLDKLTEKQMTDHLENVALTAILQIALIALGKPADYVALHDAFMKQPWAGLVERYRRNFQATGFNPIPPDHVVYGRKLDFYDSIADRIPDVELVTLYMVSGSNAVLHKSPPALAASRNLNSKFHFAQHAPAFGIPVPPTFVTTKAGLADPATADFLARHLAADGAVMLKINGLAGARNVTSVGSLHEAQDYVAQYGDDMPVLLQKKLDVRDFTEMTVDLFVADKEIRIANVRQILFADGLWVGNYVPAKTPLTAEQERQLLKVGEYARHHGLGAPEGNNCGIDFFIGPKGEIIVTEINARWTGGLFPTQAVERIGRRDENTVVCFDLVPVERIDDYLGFLEAHLPGSGTKSFSCFSLGFSPFTQDIGGTPNIYVWQVILGDFAAFHAAKCAMLPADVLPVTDKIRLPA